MRLSFLFALFLSFGSLAAPLRAETQIVYAQDGAAIAGYDPVAYFTMGQAVRGKPEHALVWKRAEWWFVTLENRALFEANPRAYAPQYGGYCAYGLARGALSTTHPEIWTIHDGRLYLIHNDRVKAVWTRDIPAHVTAADAQWPGVLRD